MPKKPKFQPRFLESEKVWVVSVPATQADTGKRTLERFATEEEALFRQKELLRPRLRRGLDEKLVGDAVYYNEVFQFLGFSGLAEACAAFERQLMANQSSPTLDSMIDAYLVDYPAKSTKHDWSRVRNALGETLCASRVATMDTDFWRDELAAVAKRKDWGPRTYNETVMWLNSLYKHAFAQRKVTYNPIQAIRPRPVPATVPDVLLPVQLEELLVSALRRQPRMALDLAILCFAGLRPHSEFFSASGLRWEDILWSQQLIKVRDSKNKDKTGAAHRYVPINNTLMTWLIAFKQDSGKIAHGGHRVWRTKLCVREDGTQIVEWTRDISRHSYGSYLAAVASSDDVRSAMGHTDYKTFARHYRNARTPEEASQYWALIYDSVKEKSLALRQT